MKKTKVLMAMSGGIDSSVSAILLLEQGYELIGVTFRAYDVPLTACNEKETGCCNINTLIEAKQMAESLGFEHHILDIKEEFKNTIIADFNNEYLNGRTPNPCVLCNATIKWGYLLDMAKELGCEKIATGHYARIGHDNNRYYLKKGIDYKKDQSYFLWKLTQDSLAQTLFPLGNLTKKEVREIAFQKGFEKLSKKSESQEICFIPDNNYRKFLKENIDNYETDYPPGHFLDLHGNIVGQHRGLPNYTIGQRKGLGISFGKRKYVYAIDPHNNTITLGDRKDLLSTNIYIKDSILHKYASIPENFEALIRIRYLDAGTNAAVEQCDSYIKGTFHTPVAAVTPGQSGVIYEGEDLIAGGIIIHPPVSN